MKIAYMGGKGLPSKSGTERVIEAIVARLVEKHTITVYCEATYTPSDTAIPGVNLVRIKTPPGKFLRPISYNVLSAIHAVTKGDYDLIHLNGIETTFILPLLRTRYPVICTSHGSAHSVPREKWGKISRPLMGFMEYPFTHYSNYSTSVSKLDASDLETRFKRRVIYIPNGVDLHVPLDKAGSLAALTQLGIEPGGFILFAAGRIDPTKGCHLAIEAYKSIDTDLPLVVMGDMEQVPSYGVQLREMAAGRPIIFSPPVMEKSLFFGILQSSKLFLFPSLSEGMSMMMLETASVGVPMIASDIPENKVVLKDLTVYFKSGNAADLAEKMRWALASSEEMDRISQKARLLVEAELTWEKIVRHYDDLYQACVAKVPYPDPGLG